MRRKESTSLVEGSNLSANTRHMQSSKVHGLQGRGIVMTCGFAFKAECVVLSLR